jgi:hypothetical protein
MTTGPAAAPAPSPAASWVLLPLAWCLWLLASLVPSLLVAPHLETLRPWLTPDTAPAAVLAAAAFFLVAIWPFWPALAGNAELIPASRWFGRTFLELMVLLALAAPFVVVAWSVGGRTLEVDSLALAAAMAVIPGAAFRLAAGAVRPQRVRWVALAAMLLAGAPLLVAYAARETLGADWSCMLRISPVYAAVACAAM